MIVKCITNDVAKLENSEVRMRLAKSINLNGEDRDLIVGDSYPVVAMAWWGDGSIRIYLHTVNVSDYPYPYPLEMFEITDQTLPANWCIGFEQRSFGLVIKRMGFPEWVNDESFYEKLIDDDEAAIAVYKKRITQFEYKL